MSDGRNEKHNRREFLRGVARGAVLGGIALVALCARRRGAPLRQSCTNGGLCRGCSAYDDCGLPQALTAKRASAEQ